jgi:hypothetical protein
MPLRRRELGRDPNIRQARYCSTSPPSPFFLLLLLLVVTCWLLLVVVTTVFSAIISVFVCVTVILVCVLCFCRAWLLELLQMLAKKVSLEQIWPALEDGVSRLLTDFNAGLPLDKWMTLYTYVVLRVACRVVLAATSARFSLRVAFATVATQHQTSNTSIDRRHLSLMAAVIVVLTLAFVPIVVDMFMTTVR